MKKNSKLIVRFFALALAAVMVLTACGGSGGSDKSSGGSPDSNTSSGSNDSSTPAEQPGNIAEVGNIDDAVAGGEMVFATGDVMGSFFSPYIQGSMIAYGWPAYQSLAVKRSDQTWDGVLAESWERDDDNCTLTVHLVQNACFSDGTPMTAEDVVFTLATRKEYSTDSTIGSPVSVEAPDDYTVVVTWESFSLSYENWILSQFIYSKKAFDEKGLDWMLNNMMGTGPYVLSEFIPDVSMTFTRNENYWEDRTPAPDSIKFVYMTDATTQLAAFVGGEIDYITAGDPNVVDQLNAGGYPQRAQDVNNAFEAQYIAIPLSIKEGDPLSDVRVRQAIFEYGIDWQTMAIGLGGSVGYHTDAIGLTAMTYYDPSIETSSFDLEKAKSLLAEAGYADGFSTTIYTSAPFSDAATVLQAGLKDLGIEAECEFVDYTLVQSDYISAKATDNGICVTCLFFPSTPQNDRFIKHINPNATYGPSSSWSDEIYPLWDAVVGARTQEAEDAALLAYVNSYVHNGSNLWPMYNTTSIAFVQEWAHFTDDSQTNAGQDPFEMWTTR